jgi:hypothetical protein
MRITIRQVSGGLIAQPPKSACVSFELGDLPEPICERAKALLSPPQLAAIAAGPASPGGADRVHYEITLADDDREQLVLIDEAACTAEFLDLLDELRSIS